VNDVDSFFLEYSAKNRERHEKVGKSAPQPTIVYPFSPAPDAVDDHTAPLLEARQISEARSQYDNVMSLVDQLFRQLVRHFAGASPDRWKFVVGDQYTHFKDNSLEPVEPEASFAQDRLNRNLFADPAS
jgi:hypothetical protein